MDDDVKCTIHPVDMLLKRYESHAVGYTELVDDETQLTLPVLRRRRLVDRTADDIEPNRGQLSRRLQVMCRLQEYFVSLPARVRGDEADAQRTRGRRFAAPE